MKTCFKCKTPKDRGDFYAHPRMLDGLLGKCKDCTKKDVTLHRINNLLKIQEYDRRRGKTEKRKARVRAYAKSHPEIVRRAAAAWIKEHPAARKATVAVNNAVRDRRLLKQPCEVCGCKTVQGHHDDYSKPLEVRWLCDLHHKAHHNTLREVARAANS